MADTVIVQARLPWGDPHDCTDTADALSLLDAVYDTPVRRGAAGLEPGLATRWAVSDDARRWRFEIAEGLRFHDGSACDAAAVALTLRRMARPDMGATLGAPGVWAQYLGGARIEAETATRLAVDLPEPMADLPDILAYAYVIAPDSLDAPQARPCGTGPFRVVQRTDDRIDVDGPRGAVAVERRAAAAARLAALADGGAAVANDLPFAAPAPAGTTCLNWRDPTAYILMFNADRPAVADPRVRRALNLALDRPALIASVLGGAGEPLVGFVSPAHPGHVASAGTAPRRDEARRLLAEAGAGGGLSLVIDTPTSLPAEAEALTAAVAAQLTAVGVGVTARRWEDREAYATMIRRSEVADLCVFDSSPMSTFRVLREKIDSRVQGSWWLGYRNPAVEALIDRARVEPDTPRRHAIFAECYRLLQADPPWLYCYTHLRRIGLRGNWRDWRMRFDGVLDLRSLPGR